MNTFLDNWRSGSTPHRVLRIAPRCEPRPQIVLAVPSDEFVLIHGDGRKGTWEAGVTLTKPRKSIDARTNPVMWRSRANHGVPTWLRCGRGEVPVQSEFGTSR